MIYKGYKIKIRCDDWGQVHAIDYYWKFFASKVQQAKLVGLGMNWTENYFDYALGVIDDEATLEELKAIDFSKSEFDAEYFEIKLPNPEEWQSFKGKEKDVRQIYEKEIDCYNQPYDYELEYMDGKGNIEIKIHYLNQA